MVSIRVPFFRQHSSYTCGPVVLEMVYRFFGMKASEKSLVRELKTSRKKGTGHRAIINSARKHGFYCFVHDNSSISQIKHFLFKGFPVIINYIEPSNDEGHYAVAIGFTKKHIILNDPWDGKDFRISFDDFLERWHDNDNHHKNWLMIITKKKLNLGRQYSPL